MCDYSLQAVKSRPAAVGDKLVTFNFGTGTTGFACPSDPETVAVCVLPGTEIAFEKAPELAFHQGYELSTTARFRQIRKESPNCHHDLLEFANGQEVLLTALKPGQNAVVLQLPAAPKNDVEKEEQRRAEYV